MKFLKATILLAILTVFAQCKSVSFEKSPPFKIMSTSYNYWSGGQPGVSGIKVAIQIRPETTVVFDSLYFQKKRTKIEMQQQEGKQLVVGFFNTSTEQPVFNAKKEPKKPVDFPFELQSNEAVISYLVKGKLHYYKVSNIKETKTPVRNQ